MDLRLITESLLSIGPARSPRNINLIACLKTNNSFTGIFNNTRSVHSRGIWQVRFRGVEARTDVSVDRVDADGMNADHYLTGSRSWILNFLYYHHLRLPEFSHADCLHNFSPLFKIRTVNSQPQRH